MKVLLICGGMSSENEISRLSATNVRRSINNKHFVKTLGITKNGEWYELKVNDYSSDDWLNGASLIKNIFEYIREFEVVFPVLHGLYGEDGTIQGLLELAGVPYVGMKVLGSSIGLDKVYTKIVLNSASIKQVPYVYIKKKYDKSLVVVNSDMEESANIKEIVRERLGYPVFVKASNSGSSVGCFKVNDEKELLLKIDEASKYDRKILVEKAINAREVECAVLGNDDVIASPVGEIVSSKEFYTYDAKYNDNSSKIVIPADIALSESDYIRNTSIKAFKALDGHGLCRCDFFIDKDSKEIYLNEVNTMPGFTNISMYPMLIEKLGISETDLIDRLLNLAISAKSN